LKATCAGDRIQEEATDKQGSARNLESASHEISRRAFWLVSRAALGLYRRFPVFGTLRAAVGIIRQGDRYLLIKRNDGRGFSFPGGLAKLRESDENAVRREVSEETGLEVTAAELDFRYFSAADVPCNISVFKVGVAGDLRGSWEGLPQWVERPAIRTGILKSQIPIVERILNSE
jgi:ADP-ribose pyrophosphatase YjhB (NUDIX family)